MKFLRIPLLFLSLACALPAPAQTAPAPTWDVGQPAPAFSAYDEKGIVHSLADFTGQWIVFDVSAAWCLPSFEFADAIRRVKTVLAAQEIPLVSFTLVDQGPLEEPLVGRSQALAWKLAFPESDVVVGHHIGFSNLLDPVPELRSLIGTTYHRKGFPTFVIIDPTGIIRYVGGSVPTADGLLALILPDQPPITEPPRDVTAGFFGPEVAPEVTVRVGSKWGRSLHPRITSSGGFFSIPALEQGSLSHQYGIGIGFKPSTSQQIVNLFYDTRLPQDFSEPGIPSDQDITFRLHVPRFTYLHPFLTAATAKVGTLDYVNGAPAVSDAPVTAQGRDLVVGPFRVGGTSFPARAIDIDLVVTEPTPSLLAAQSADLCLAFAPNNASGPVLYSQWLAVENAAELPRTVAACDLLLERLRSLRRSVAHAPAGDLGRAQRIAFLKIADEIRHSSLEERISLRRSARTSSPATKS